MNLGHFKDKFVSLIIGGHNWWWAITDISLRGAHRASFTFLRSRNIGKRILFCSFPRLGKGFHPPQSWKPRAQSVWAAHQRIDSGLAEDMPIGRGSGSLKDLESFPDMISGVSRAINLLPLKSTHLFPFFLTRFLLSLKNAQTTLTYWVHPSKRE